MKMKLIVSINLWIIFSFAVNSQENILLIIADDIGIDYSSGYSSVLDIPSIPNIDKLASEGILFENAWSNPLCSPTRATILTGKYGFRTGVGAPVGGTENPGISTDEYTLPKALKELAPVYADACIGKWHLATTSNGGKDNPNLVGFTHYSGNKDGGLDDYYLWDKFVDGSKEVVSNYATTENINDAINWIEDQDSAWFLWLAFNAVHSPFHKPPDTLHSYGYLSEYTSGEDPVPYYKAMVEAMDSEIGRLLQYLHGSGQYSSTNIIYVGDNGTSKGVIQSPYNKNQSKGTLYEGGVHVPLIISGPTVVSPSRKSGALVSTVDIFNTVLSMAGIDTENQLHEQTDSKSLLPVLNNETDTHRSYLYSELFGAAQNNGITVRNAEYHLIIFEDGGERFYNINADKYENSNLLENDLTTVEEINYNILKQYAASIKDTSGYSSTFPVLQNQVKVTVEGDVIKFEIEPNLHGSCIVISDFFGRTLYQSRIYDKILNTPKFKSPLIISVLNGGRVFSKKIHF